MTTHLQRRLARLEPAQIAGTRADLEESEFLFVRLPEDSSTARMRDKLERCALDLGKQLRVVSGPAAASMSPGVLTPLNLIPDAVLDDETERLRDIIGSDRSFEKEDVHGQSAQWSRFQA